MTGETVLFSTSGDVTFSSVTDNANGTYNATITASTTAGVETITATDGPVHATAILYETAYCPGTCYTQTTPDDFLAGTPGSSTYVAETQDGEVISRRLPAPSSSAHPCRRDGQGSSTQTLLQEALLL